MKIFTFLFILSLSLSVFISAEEIVSTSTQENELWQEWDSPEGLSRLQKSNAKENLWKLIRFYEAQARLTYCSVATSVITLNALSIKSPKSQFLGKYHMFTQEEFFSESVQAVIDQNEVAKRGMALEELATVLGVFPIKVFKYEAQHLPQEKIRDLIISALKNPNQCVLALYQRKELQQEGGGHWSPIAAYDVESDSFLILDVARFKYPPVWIDAFAFINSMQTANIYGKSRGFIIIEKNIADVDVNCDLEKSRST